MTDGSKNKAGPANITDLTPITKYDTLTLADFESERPYRMLMDLADRPFDQDTAFRKMRDQADLIGYKGFLDRWRRYQKQNKMIQAKPVGNVAAFTGMPYPELDAGVWFCTDDVIYTRGERGELIACTHPILPIERLTNVDTGLVKTKLAYKPGKYWKEIIVERSVLASPQKIILLADHDVAVTSETAKNLIKYLSDVEALNYSYIPEQKSTTRLGWLTDNVFLPYSDGIQFDGQASYKSLFESVQQHGSFKEWVKEISGLRRSNKIVRIALAASFTSVILQKIDALSTFVHMWTPESATGKTVIAMVAASVWGNPEVGKFIQTFNTTEVASEFTCAFLNSLPLIMDELQLAKDRYGNLKFNVYKIAQGVGRARGTKTGGIERTPTWRLCSITTGETPLTSLQDGAGAFARVVDIEIDTKLISLEDGQRIVKTITRNYGHAGKVFIDAIKDIPKDDYTARYDEIVRQIRRESDAQDKQIMTAAALLLGDEMADDYVFHDEQGRLSFDDILPYLQTADDFSIDRRAYDYLLDWIASNGSRFESRDDGRDRFGMIENDKVYIIRSKFNEAMQQAGISPRTAASALAKAGLIEVDPTDPKKRTDVRKRIEGNLCRCIALLPNKGIEISSDGSEYL